MEKEKELLGTGFFYNMKWTHMAYTRSCISTFERRYGMSSSTIGFIVSLQEVVHIVATQRTPATLQAIRQYLLNAWSEPHVPNQDGSDLRALCLGRENVSALVACHEGSQSSSQAASESQTATLILTLSQVLFGMGSVPIQPFGILQASIPLGFSFGSFLSAITLQIYVDVDKVDMDSVTLTPSDLDWVGAWWIGVLFTSCFLGLASIPMFFFRHPKRPAINDAPSDDPDNQSMVNFLKSFPGILLNMLCSRSFVLLILADCAVYLSLYGFSNFLMKFLEVQYNATASYINLLTGLTYPISSIGLLVGGLFIKSSKTPFRNLPWVCFGAMSLSTCWANCSCSDSVYVPVCGEDGKDYVSPCHGGCTNFTMNSQNQTQLVYTQCSCVPSADGDKMGIARPGKCLQSICSGFLYVSLAILTVTIFLMGFVNTVLYVMLIRYVVVEVVVEELVVVVVVVGVVVGVVVDVAV
ncbi:hypothetical protein CRUP_028938, partial [Coryphaenoides rupestris]